MVPGASGQVAALIAAGVLGFKAFLCHSGIDEFPNATEAELRAVMPELASAGMPLLVHAELAEPGADRARRRRRSREPQLRAASRVATARLGSTTRSAS